MYWIPLSTKKSLILPISILNLNFAEKGASILLWCLHGMIINNHYDTYIFSILTGSMLDVDRKEIIFYHNGKPLQAFSNVFEQVLTGFFAAASFMSFQQCQVIYFSSYFNNCLKKNILNLFSFFQFNFGASPFKYPPKDRHFQAFNDHATLPPEDKVILPR